MFSKLASKHHRLDKQAAIEECRANFPDESAPMYQKHSNLFKQKFTSQSVKSLLMEDELIAQDVEEMLEEEVRRYGK